MGNGALDTNPPVGDRVLTVNGSDWLWAVTAVEIVSFLAFASLAYAARSGERIFHYLFTIAALTGAIAYFAIASDLGYSVIAQADHVGLGLTRQIFFAKFVYWVVSFPTVIIALGLLSGVSWATILYHVFLSWVWVLSYVSAAYTSTNYKWGFYAFGTVAWLLLAIGTLFHGGRGVRRIAGTGVESRHHTFLAGWANLLWLLYPIAFGLSDGGNRIGVTGSFIFYGILDVLFIPVLGFAFIFLARAWDFGRLNIAFTQYGRVHAPGGTFPEKGNAPAAGGVAAPEQAV